jgi:hypothetical protein
VSARWLIGCERSGAVRRAMRARGVDAWSCDLFPADDGSPHHIQGDVLEAIKGEWGGAIVFPDCTYLTVSGLHWNVRRPERSLKTDAAVAFVEELWAHRHRIGRMALENPRGCLPTRSSLGKPSQVIQPHQFGHDASKATCLWLYGLEALAINPANQVAPRIVGGRPRWANQTDSGQNRLPPSPDRARLRSETYAGIAAAMTAWAVNPSAPAFLLEIMESA